MIESYSIVNGLAYTEDNILIYNLEISSVLCNLRSKVFKLNNFFRKMDVKSRVRFLNDVSEGGNACMVHFSKAEYATNILKEYKDCLHVGGEQFLVRPCQSFYQPDGQKFIQQIDALLEAESSESTEMISSYSSNSTNQEALIFNLNDDCLEHICKRLCPLNQVNFALACKRFWFILNLIARIKYAVVDMDNFCCQWTLLKDKNFYQIVGPHIKTLVFQQNDVDLDLHKYCFNVEKLTVHDVTNIKKLLKLIENMPHLEELHINSTDIDDDFIQSLETLKKLYIFNSSCLTFTTNRLPSHLKELSIIGCSQISATSLRNICMNLKNLSHFEITKNDTYWNTEDYKCIIENLVQLKVLRIGWSKGEVFCLTQLQNLIQLQIDIKLEDFKTDFAAKLTEFVNEQLENPKYSIYCDIFPSTEAV